MRIGNGEFYHGDCLDVMRGLPDASVDMVLCDLPYGTTACSWDSVIPFEPLWEQYWRVLRENGAVALTASQPFTTALIASQIDQFAFSWVWNKVFGGNFVQAKRQPIKTHEDVVVFSRDGRQPAYHPQMIKRDKPIKKGGNKQSKAIPIAETESSKAFGASGKTYDEKYPVSIVEFSSRDDARGLHPTQKPVALFEYLIRTYTRPGETVMDNCMGSGTTAIAAERSGRRWIGIERDEGYYNAALARIWTECAA